MEESIYELALHEDMRISTTYSTIDVIRVPGGWIYSLFTWNCSTDSMDLLSTVFVPFNTEFKFKDGQG